MAKYGSLYAQVEYESHKEALKYTWYFCIRRLVFGAIIAFLTDVLVIQVLLLTELTLLMAAWGVAETPMINFLNDLAFIANELILLFSSYFVLLFSRYVPDLLKRYNFGFFYLTIFVITTAFNLILLITILCHDFKQSLRLKALKKIQMRLMKIHEFGKAKNVSKRRARREERKKMMKRYVAEEIEIQMKREGRIGDWHRVMKNRDQVHLSQLEQYKTQA